ncbi:MAG: termination factor Rho [Pseudomonas sp.]|nr:termination factor Rho [Pseudomonas sp.]
MTRGSKAKYSLAQRRKAAAIEASYEDRGLSPEQAEARAWATVNKQSGGGERAGGSGRNKSQADKARARSESAQRAVATRQGYAFDRAAHFAVALEEGWRVVNILGHGVAPC